MLRVIIIKELLDTFYSLKFVLTFLLCTILILLSVYTGVNSYRSELKAYEASVALNQSNLESQPSYMSLANMGIKISKPPRVLGTLVTGIQDAVGRVAVVKMSMDPNLTESKYNTNPVFSIFGELDLTFIVKIVLSLLALLFTYDAICGDKERGTLKLALSNSVPRDRLLLGKAIGSFISLLLPLLISLLIGLLILNVYPDVNFTGEDWLRIGLLVLLFLLYIMVFFTLGLFISARSTRPEVSFLVQLIVWICFVTVIPKTAVIAAGQIYPVPSVHEITAQKDAFLQDIRGSSLKQSRDWLQENLPKSPDDAKGFNEKHKQFIEDRDHENDRKIDEYNSGLETEFQAKRKMQEKIAINLARISPASALMFGAMNLGGTGIDEHQRFLSSIKNYKPAWAKWAGDNTIHNLASAAKKPDLSDMPRHSFTPETLGQSVRRALPDFVVLTLLVVVFFAGAYVSFLRYDVR
jgi:ABC-2 type transport system permease protein